ncbi:terpene synthase family protein [Cognatiyoonia sp. IB215182]|uniref:terpene synthase family protein n=1 Tax=Cognatiyoonia sp. IB215182 TaxID=3097353 RepID=UPI002A0ACD6C|nr:hypothetical protein [Cognatiyoonia sp. IB215182]MDX8355778.1 hypothetical protein [Cognatiyoonia sp. IB215182]
MARCYPNASRVDLQWISDWVSWIFLFDDQNDEAEQGRGAKRLTEYRPLLLDIMRGTRAQEGSQMLQAWHDLWARIRPKVDPSWLERLTQQHDDYFLACIWEASNRKAGTVPDTKTYLLKRLDSGAVYPCLTIIEFVGQLNLPESVLHHPVISDLSRCTNNLVCWSNDIVSLEKEVKNGDVHNLVIALSNEHQISLQEATDKAVVMYETEMERFEALIGKVPQFSTEINIDLQSYIEGLKFWIQGNLDWSFESHRYRAASSNHK